jgi:hypothetical protein
VSEATGTVVRNSRGGWTMTTEIGVGLVALAAGLAIGARIAAERRARMPADRGVESRLELQAAELRRLADAASVRDVATERLHDGVDAVRRAVELLEIRERQRHETDAEGREVVRRLSTVLAGGAARGRAGENVLREHLSQLPPGMLVHDMRVGGKVVEFALALPDGRRLPIDSKWTATAELETLEAATTTSDRETRARAVERAVTLRAREVAQYVDPSVTAPVAVAAVPDAAYAVLKRAHADAYAKGVVIVPYSAALPIVLFLYALVSRFGDGSEVQTTLTEIVGVLDAIESVVENKVSRAARMLGNGADELRSCVGKARGSIARAGVADVPAAEPTPSPSGEADRSIVDRAEADGRLAVLRGSGRG